ncbi:MAG: hypothetical protein WA989_15745 [Henriciella sp.]
MRLRFVDIERILGFTLPASARRYSAWWANDASAGRQSQAWLSTGWRTAKLDLDRKAVSFVREHGESRGR